MEESIRVGLVQMRCSSQPQENLDKALRLIEKAAESGCQVVCLQELFRSLYFCQEEDERQFDLAEPIPGPTTDALGSLAKKLQLVIVGSVFEKRAPGIYHNTAVVLDADGALAGKYRKMHIPDDPYYYEKFYFTPGDLGFQSHATARGNIGVLVCWDQWFPEAARITTLAGASILLYPTAIGWGKDQSERTNLAQHEAWELIQRGHAVANGVFVASVNRVGAEEDLRFWGQSFVCDPFGRIIARASADSEEILVADLDMKLVEKIRREWCFLRDRRVDAYGGLTSLYLD